MKKLFIPLVFLAGLGVSAHVAAGPADYVVTPGVEYGEREIDFKFGSFKRSDEDRLSAASIGFGYGATQRWFTELYLKYNREGGSGTQFDAWEWENKFQLTETGQYPVDLGFLLEIERPQDRSEGYEVTFGPLLQTEFGKTQLNGNLLFKRNYRADFPNSTELNYQWQAKYRWKPQFEFGVQGFGELGQWNDWGSRDEQSHRLGPAVFGKFALGGHQVIKYNAAYLVDASDAKHSNTLRTQIEYEF